MDRESPSAARAWSWIPSLYFVQGVPNVAVATLSVVMYKNLGVSNTDIALYTSWLYLPWVIKPLWSPWVDVLGRKRLWIVASQVLLGALFASVALTIPAPGFFQATLALFWLVAFSSATHDIAADGFYLLALREHQRAAFVGVRSVFFRLAMIAGQGGLVYQVGRWMREGVGAAQAWSWMFGLVGGGFAVVALYHHLVLPRPAEDVPAPRKRAWAAEWMEVFAAFFRKPRIVSALAFLLLYRFAEAQLVKLVQPFLLDARTDGGLGLTTDVVGWLYGVNGTIALLAGGVLGGWIISRFGLKRLLWPMACAINVPNLAYVYLAMVQPEQVDLVRGAIVIEQFGYGFGFAAYMLFMMYLAEGEHKTAHYAICTGFMALGMMLPGMVSGWLQEQLGYGSFFIWVCGSTVSGFLVTAWVTVPREYGRKREPGATAV